MKFSRKPASIRWRRSEADAAIDRAEAGSSAAWAAAAAEAADIVALL
jgi:hypothetical protein